MEHHRDEAEQLVGLTTVAQCQHHVLVGHHTEVAVIYVQRVDIESRCTCRGEGSCNLGTHVSALAHTRNDDLALAMIHHIYGFLKIIVQ